MHSEGIYLFTCRFIEAKFESTRHRILIFVAHQFLLTISGKVDYCADYMSDDGARVAHRRM